MTEAPWRLQVAAPVHRQLERLPEKAAVAIIESFRAIAANPKAIGKPLRFELKGLRVARRGPYRVVYAIDDAERTVTVVRVGHRARIYRRRY